MNAQGIKDATCQEDSKGRKLNGNFTKELEQEMWGRERVEVTLAASPEPKTLQGTKEKRKEEAPEEKGDLASG